jgi:CRP-like cAMP-binding protein
MPKAPPARIPPGNQLLARLPAGEYERLSPHLHAVQFDFRQVLYEARSPIDYAYFPVRGTASALTVMDDGSSIEVATVGNEGMVGLTVFLGEGSSPNKVIIQVAGDGLRVKADVLKMEAGRDGPLRDVLLRYHNAYLTQVSYSVACNGLHVVQQRCCRWLLMTQDRVDNDRLPLTHEFLAIMLGVRRPTVTEVLRPLQDRKLIQIGRGLIRVVDREGLEAISCECYQRVREEFTRLLG